MAAIVEAERDGRLDAPERASLARHLAGCAECRDLARDLGRLAELAARPVMPEASELEHQRGRLALLRAAAHDGAASGPKPRAGKAGPDRDRSVSPGRRNVATVLVAVAVIAASLGGLVHEAHDGLGGAPSQVASARKLPPIPRPRVEPLPEVSVRAAADTRFDRLAGEAKPIELREGALDVDARAAGGRAVVVTDDAEVTGPAFRVEARDRRIVSVIASEGTVEVRYAGALTRLSAGELWSSPPREPVTPDKPPPRAATPHHEKANPKDPGAFAEGMRLVERGDYAAGAAALERFSDASPADQRAEDAAYLAILALQRAGKRDAAAAAARRYLARYPNGYRRAEVEPLAAGKD
jgi:TolA-binding protein